jgi:hypothetical protein
METMTRTRARGPDTFRLAPELRHREKAADKPAAVAHETRILLVACSMIIRKFFTDPLVVRLVKPPEACSI